MMPHPEVCFVLGDAVYLFIQAETCRRYNSFLFCEKPPSPAILCVSFVKFLDQFLYLANSARADSLASRSIFGSSGSSGRERHLVKASMARSGFFASRAIQPYMYQS